MIVIIPFLLSWYLTVVGMQSRNFHACPYNVIYILNYFYNRSFIYYIVITLICNICKITNRVQPLFSSFSPFPFNYTFLILFFNDVVS